MYKQLLENINYAKEFYIKEKKLTTESSKRNNLPHQELMASKMFGGRN